MISAADYFPSSFDHLKPCDPMMNGPLTEAPQLIGEASGGGCDHNNDGLAVFQISYLFLSSLRIQVPKPLPSSS